MHVRYRHHSLTAYWARGFRLHSGTGKWTRSAIGAVEGAYSWPTYAMT